MAQQIDLTLLQPPLVAIPDDATAGGTPGHVAIVPVDNNGKLNQQLLEEWAAARAGGVSHWLSEIVMNAVVKVNLRQQP